MMTLRNSLLLSSALLLAALPPAMAATPAPPQQDPYLWLEDVLGTRSLDWVHAQNARTTQELEARPDFAALRADVLGALDAKDRIPAVTRMGPWLYNLWQDEDHKRGLWRRTTLAEYAKAQPQWETVLDVDALGQAEGQSWVFHGAQCLAPDYRRCMLLLSPGGSDAGVAREFDVVDKQFVKGGFEVPQAKSELAWADADTLYVASDFGAGSLTDSGYPRTIRRWVRGSALADAPTVFEGEQQDVSVGLSVDRTPGFERTVFARALDFFHQTQFLYAHDAQGDKLTKLDVPSDVITGFWQSHLLLQPREAWKIGAKTYAPGSLLVADAAAWLRGERGVRELFVPTPTRSLAGYTTTRDALILNVSDKVASRLEEWNFAGATPQRREIAAPFPGKLSVAGLYDSELPADELGDRYLMSYTDFLTPDTLYLGRAGSDARETLKQRSALFDADGMRVEQRFAKSRDGTSIPYFVVWPKGAQADGTNPTLLYGYGGFEVSMEPFYLGARGRAWLARGGVFVLANIRGGGEFGPAWHQAAVKARHQNAFDDFAAVAADLIKHRITTPRHLGIQGGSNGGLLMGATLVQHPELFNAVVCQVPLLDMQRYNKLLAGASWMAEYGNPDVPAEWAYIRKYSPYQNVKAGVKYPRVLFTTSTRDDRVHPGHARKMAARMEEQGHDVLYWENTEGGHGGAADNGQRATMQALEYGFLWEQLGR